MLRLPKPKNALPPPPAATSTPSSTTSTSVTSYAPAASIPPTQAPHTANPTDLIPLGPASARASVLRPAEDVEADIAAETTRALQAIVQIKSDASSANGPNSILLSQQSAGSSDKFLRVDAARDALTGRVTSQRVLRTVERASDPLEPPKFKFRAAPKPPGSPPAPVLREAPKRATKEELEAWSIPRAVSSWKDPNGNILGIETRLAHIHNEGPAQASNRFAELAESLTAAADQSRVALAERARIREETEQRRREEESEALRLAAAEARAARQQAQRGQDEEAKMREETRRELRREIQQEMRASKSTTAQVQPPPTTTGEAQFDARLFELAGKGLGASVMGHEEDESSSAYTTSLFREVAAAVYRPSTKTSAYGSAEAAQLDELAASAAKFEGRAASTGGATTSTRSAGPVQFERYTRPKLKEDHDEDFVDNRATNEAKRAARSVLDSLTSSASGSLPTMSMARASASSGGGGRSTKYQKLTPEEDDPTGEYSASNAQIERALGGGKPSKRRVDFVKSSDA